MEKEKLKIFLSYHKKTPCYKSEVFQPIHVGAENSAEIVDFAISDNTGENISYLNPYYCELTGYYWVLKNYINHFDDAYIGFSHYRRLPDILNISDADTPSIYGMGYNESKVFFEEMDKSDLAYYCKDFDIILPCSVYLYAKTVNPQLRSDEEHYNVYDQFKIEHNGSDLLDRLKIVIESDYPQYINALSKCFLSERTHSFNIYIMKKELLKSFLEWEFDILEKVGKLAGGWEQDKYHRMAGFVGECLINVWLNYNNTLKKGYVPIYMVDFENDYIVKANKLHEAGNYLEEIAVLKELLPVSSQKFDVCFSITRLYINIEDKENTKLFLEETQKHAISSEEFYELAELCKEIEDSKKAEYYYIKAIENDSGNKYYASAFLFYAESTKNLNLINNAWSYMLNFELTQSEQLKYDSFKRIFSKIC